MQLRTNWIYKFCFGTLLKITSWHVQASLPTQYKCLNVSVCKACSMCQWGVIQSCQVHYSIILTFFFLDINYPLKYNYLFLSLYQSITNLVTGYAFTGTILPVQCTVLGQSQNQLRKWSCQPGLIFYSLMGHL